MLFSKNHVKTCAQYFEKLERYMPFREGDPEFAHLTRPWNTVFRQMEIVSAALCELGGQSIINAHFAVTDEGYMELIFPGYRFMSERAWIRIEDKGVRMYNALKEEEKFLPGIQLQETLEAELKAFMKPYL
jgi:hypothetical protein